MTDVSVIILTKNEELHIERALRNAKQWAREIFVVDSYSTDRTTELAAALGAKVFQHKWENYSRQLKWALETLPIQTEWIWRQDADEYLTPELMQEISQRLSTAEKDVSGFTAPCLRRFMGREIKHGIIPLQLLRLFKHRCGTVEDKMMDEHITIHEGRIEDLSQPFYDDNLNGLTFWTDKHNGYATREAIDLLMTEYMGGDTVANSGEHSAAIRKKKLKYTRLPLFWRAFALFCYRYFFRLGFLDGKEGFLWHFLQGFWYRALADAKVYEIKKQCHFRRDEIIAYLQTNVLAPQMGGGKNVINISFGRIFRQHAVSAERRRHAA